MVSNIKAVKTHRCKVIGNQILTYEEMNTVLAQMKALLNSRPLSWLSLNPTEVLSLTPVHFLTLTLLQVLQAVDVADVKLPSRKQLLDKFVQSYWKG